MEKYLEAFVAKTNSRNTEKKIEKLLLKTLENIAYERAGKIPPHDDTEIFSDLISLKKERIETIDALSDEAALIARTLFDEWNPNAEYSEGDRFLYNGNLYRCKKKNPINPTWTPDVVHEYYEPIAKPTENGTLDKPITAVEGMEYEIGKYYAEDGKIYLCAREGMNTGDKITLHYLPSDLVGQYFKEVSENA